MDNRYNNRGKIMDNRNRGFAAANSMHPHDTARNDFRGNWVYGQNDMKRTHEPVREDLKRERFAEPVRNEPVREEMRNRFTGAIRTVPVQNDTRRVQPMNVNQNQFRGFNTAGRQDVKKGFTNNPGDMKKTHTVTTTREVINRGFNTASRQDERRGFPNRAGEMKQQRFANPNDFRRN